MSIEVLKIPFDGEYLIEGDAISKTALTIVEDGLDLTTCTIKMQLYYYTKQVLDVANGAGITVIDAQNIEIDVIAANVLPEGVSVGDLQITTAANVTMTYMRLEFNVLKQYTR